MAVVVALATAATGCANSGDQDRSGQPDGIATNSAAKVAAHPELAAMLPDAVGAKGKIIWGTEPYLPPFQMTGDDQTSLVGVNVDLASAITDLLGVKSELSQSTFDGLIPGLSADRFDAVLDAMYDTAPRREQVNFIDYVTMGSPIFVPQENPHSVAEMEDLCGLKVGVNKGTAQVGYAEDQSAACTKKGASSLDIQVYPDESPMLLAMTSGRVDAVLMDSAAGGYAAEQSKGAFKSTGAMSSTVLGGIAVAKDDEALLKALQAAVQELMDNGEYTKILKKWGVADLAMDTATINKGGG